MIARRIDLRLNVALECDSSHGTVEDSRDPRFANCTPMGVISANHMHKRIDELRVRKYETFRVAHIYTKFQNVN